MTVARPLIKRCGSAFPHALCRIRSYHAHAVSTQTEDSEERLKESNLGQRGAVGQRTAVAVAVAVDFARRPGGADFLEVAAVVVAGFGASLSVGGVA